jgi:hypothetical protein
MRPAASWNSFLPPVMMSGLDHSQVSTVLKGHGVAVCRRSAKCSLQSYIDRLSILIGKGYLSLGAMQ